MKRILLILLIVFTTVLYSQGQSRIASLTDTRLVNFYPNPATSYITFDLLKSTDKGYTLEVYSFLGKKMFQAANINQRTTIDLTTFNRGVYIYQLRDRGGKMITSGKFHVSK